MSGKYFLVTGLILFMITHSAAGSTPAPYDIYDGINPDVRSASMGGAGVCSKRGAPAMYFNPAGLCGIANFTTFSFKVKQSPKELERSDILGGRSLIFLGFSGGDMGIAWSPLSNIKKCLLSGTTIEVKVNKFTMGFSNRLSGNLDFGMNINFFNGFMGITGATADISDANGYGIDWGIIYRMHPNITLGSSFFNAPSSVRWSGYGSENLPLVIRHGGTVKLPGLFEVSSEVETRSYRKERPLDGKKRVKIYHFGIEQNFFNIISFRGGMFGEDLNDEKKSGYSAGIGWAKDRAVCDIAWQRQYLTPADKDYLQTYFVSVTVPF